jgi:hypothetical protein
MATYYLKNTSGTTVTLRDLGIVLEDGLSLPIDSNDITGWLTPDMADALNTPSDLILSTTDIGDSSGDFSPADAILALSLVSRINTNNPTNVTFTQASQADPNTDITAAEAEELTDGSDTTLHHHDNRYYTETELSTPNAGTVSIHWDNIISAPDVGAPQWQEPVDAIVEYVGATAPSSPNLGDFYIDTSDNHVYKYDGTTWVDQGNPVTGDRVVNRDTNEIMEWDGVAWVPETPVDNTSVLVEDDGDDKGAQYIFNGTEWKKIADVDWGTHNSIGGRDQANTHPATSISYNNSLSGLTASTVQEAIDEIALEGGVDIDNLLVVAKNGDDTKPGVRLGTFANPYATIQAAIDSVPTSGGNAATADNPYLVLVMPGQYEENVNTSKEYAYIAGWDKDSTIITSSADDTMTIATTGPESSALYNITIESTSTDGADNALSLTGNNPRIQNVIIRATSGARSTYISGSYNYTFDNVRMVDGTFRIDNGTTTFNRSSVSGAQTVITNGSVFINNSQFQFANGNVISQTGGSVRFVFGRIISGSSFNDYNQSSGSVAWGWIDASDRLLFDGTFELIFKSEYLFFDNSISGLTSTTVQGALTEIDGSLDNVYNDFNTHVNDTTNPHQVTFTQVVAADTGTDITTAEAETLTNGSIADALHTHNADNIIYNNSTVDELDTTDVQASIDYIAEHYRVDPANVVFVAKNGDDTDLPNGHRGSAGAPYATIQAALNRIELNNDNTMDNPYLVWIAPGLYEESVIINDNRFDNLTFAGNNAIVRSAGDAFRSSLLNGGLSKLEFDNLVIDGGIYFEGAVDGGNTFESVAKIQNSEITGNITGKNLVSLELEDVYFDGSMTVENISDVVFRNVRHESGNSIGLTYNATSPKPVNSVQTHFTIRDSNVKSSLSAGTGVVVESFNSTLGNVSSNTIINGEMITYGGWLAAGSTAVNATGELTTRGTFFNKPSLIVQPSGIWNNETKSDVVYYDNTITQIPADNVQDAIDNLKAQVDAFKIPKGDTFPANPEDADLFYRTDLSITYQYDGSRGKWLSTTQMTFDWGSNNADGKYLNIHGAVATMSGYLMPRSGTIIAVTAKIASGNQTKDIEIRRNHDTASPMKIFSLVGGSYASVSENIDFAQGDYLQAFVSSTGTPARDIVVVATIAWGE